MSPNLQHVFSKHEDLPGDIEWKNLEWNPKFNKIIIEFISSNKLIPIKVISCIPEKNLVMMVLNSAGLTSILKVCPTSKNPSSEVLCLSSIHHHGIVKLYQSMFQNGVLILLMEKIHGKALIDFISETRLSEEESRIIMKQLVSSLNLIHSKGWVHRDIKPDNLIYDRETQHVTIIDFELCSQIVPKNRPKFCSRSPLKKTEYYASPELRRGRFCGPETDVWSLGVTLFTMLTGFFPFDVEDLRNYTEKLFFPPDIWITPLCKDLISKMLIHDSFSRITLKEIEQHSWISQNY